MKERLLGRTGLSVSEVSLGGLFISSFGAGFDEARRAVRRGVELGVNYIDTAPGYGDSEAVLGRILPDIDAPLILSTKFGAGHSGTEAFDPQDRTRLLREVEESLRLLRRDPVDLMLVHEPDRPNQYDWWTDIDSAEGPVLDLMLELRRQGLIRYLGLGGTTAYEMTSLVGTGNFDVLLTALNYSMLWREAELTLLPEAKRQNVGVIIGSPLQMGALARRWDLDGDGRFLSPPRRDQFRALYRYLDEIEMPIAEAGLRFVLSNPDISCVLTGARSQREVEANVAAAEKGALPTEVIERLDEIARLVPFRPCAEPWVFPFGDQHYKGPGPG
jgi:aryl-alcohol dehydrogenase-like predicted oxidoreductase